MSVIKESTEIIVRNKKEWNIPAPTQHYKVVIHCSTYNHSRYIEDALKGFVMQETSFPFCAIIVDDASTDNNADIIRRYGEKYPDIIKPICLGYNHMQHGLSRNPYFDCWHEAGEYLAQCEGDDYWIDPKKLQKQVDYLDMHPDVVYSCHRYNFRHGVEKKLELQPNRFFDKIENAELTEFVFDKEYAFTQEWITKTLTCVYRRDALPKNYAKGYKYARDVHMVYSLLCNGKGVCHNFIGGTYRYTSSGVFAGIEEWRKGDVNYRVFLELYKKTKDPLFKGCAEGNLRYAMYKGRRLGLPTNIIEYKIYKEFLGRNPMKLIKVYLRKYHKPLFEEV